MRAREIIREIQRREKRERRLHAIEMATGRITVERPEYARLTDVEIARRVGVTPKTIMRWRKSGDFAAAERSAREARWAENEAALRELEAYVAGVKGFGELTARRRFWREYVRQRYGR